MKFTFIAAEKAHYPVSVLCRCLGVARSGFYAWAGRPPSQRRLQDRALLQRVRMVHTSHRQAYGRPRLHRALRDEGVRISPKGVARLMRAAGLTARGRRVFRVTTDSRHSDPVAANHLERRFAVAPPRRSWAADITGLPMRGGWCYLAVVLDLGSRRVVGWALRESLETELVLAALHVALGTRPAPQLHHSDRGTQYASHAYRELLATQGIGVSMSRVGNWWDNAAVESFFSSLKAELVAGARFSNAGEAEIAVSDYLRFYNQQRLHSALGYQSPAQYEATFGVAV